MKGKTVISIVLIAVATIIGIKGVSMTLPQRTYGLEVTDAYIGVDNTTLTFHLTSHDKGAYILTLAGFYGDREPYVFCCVRLFYEEGKHVLNVTVSPSLLEDPELINCVLYVRQPITAPTPTQNPVWGGAYYKPLWKGNLTELAGN